MYNDKNQNYFELYKIYKIKDKIIAILKTNITRIIIEKKFCFIYIRSKCLKRSIFYSSLVNNLIS